MLGKRSPYQEDSLWYYAPNKGAPITFAIWFTISGIWHIYQCRKYKSWKVTGLLPWSAMLFTGGFVLRAVAAWGHWDNLVIYIISTVLLLAGPPVYEAANYLVLGRILYYIPYHSPIHPGRVFTTFLAMSLVIEVLTGNGGALVANVENTQRKQDIGKGLLKASLILQLVLMAGFLALTSKFHYNCRRGGVLNRKVKHALCVLYCSCGLITVRTIYRTVEYFTAASLNVSNIQDISPVLKDEWFFWLFEAAVMYMNTTMLNIFHPMQWLPRSCKIYLARDGITELEGPGYDDHRPFLLTLFDPFDLVGLCKNGGRQERFWEGETARSVPTIGNTKDGAAAV